MPKDTGFTPEEVNILIENGAVGQTVSKLYDVNLFSLQIGAQIRIEPMRSQAKRTWLVAAISILAAYSCLILFPWTLAAVAIPKALIMVTGVILTSLHYIRYKTDVQRHADYCRTGFGAHYAALIRTLAQDCLHPEVNWSAALVSQMSIEELRTQAHRALQHVLDQLEHWTEMRNENPDNSAILACHEHARADMKFAYDIIKRFNKDNALLDPKYGWKQFKPGWQPDPPTESLAETKPLQPTA